MSERLNRRNVLRIAGASAVGGSLVTQSATGRNKRNKTNSEHSPLPPVVGNDPPQDLDDDGLYEDIDGDGQFTIFDVQAFFVNFQSEPVQNNPVAFNFSEDENPEETGVTIFDVQGLFIRLTNKDELEDVVTVGPDGEQVTLSLMHDPSDQTDPDIAAQIQDDLNRIGIDVELLETSNILKS
ncbi:MAG: hypothetical protein J07HX64_00109 [halophilic archaeon J07HX64]|jgi:hypothetical protein|nr:MAG: hypothetical protein J07HX64_00109 [halophilic archaeon J07HX64]